LDVRDLSVTVAVGRETRPILRKVRFAIPAGTALGLVGESGSGKSMTARAVTRLLPQAATVEGDVRFDGVDVNTMRGSDLSDYRRRGMAFVPQDPMSSVNPVHRVGDFLTEALRVNEGVSRTTARYAAEKALLEVGITDPERCMDQYPHQLSGGMLQRVIMCAALLARSRLIVADEPTTALDVTTQAEVVAILNDLRQDHDLALLFITHDLELAAAVCDRIAVMYAGEIVEEGAAETLEREASHPYTRALFAARPALDRVQNPLPAIPGAAVAASEAVSGCSFADRCSWAIDECRAEHPALTVDEVRSVRCIRAAEVRAASAADSGGRR
jgi:oligopeptide/dipeptide ABC transporter ATP-binding protein